MPGRRNRIGRGRAECPKAPGTEATVAQQHVMAFEWLRAHAVQDTLQLGAVAAVGFPAEFLGQIQAGRIDFVHMFPWREASKEPAQRRAKSKQNPAGMRRGFRWTRVRPD